MFDFDIDPELDEVRILQEMYINLYKDRVGVKPRMGTETEWQSVEWLKEQIEIIVKE
jgi:hypothetical protein